MSNIKNNSMTVSRCSPHTVLKFNLIECYVAKWSNVLSASNLCKTLIFIDPMSNSGVYVDNTGNEIEGTAIRVARILKNIADQNPAIKVLMLVNDIKQEKINRLREEFLLRGLQDTDNFRAKASCGDRHDFLERIGKVLKQKSKSTIHTLLFYDPYDADIDWGVIEPFINRWGEVIINHYFNDPIRGLSQAKDKLLVYERTYKTDSEKLYNDFRSNPKVYQERLREIIRIIRSYKPEEYWISGFPFFNTKNGLLYEIVHLTSHDKGFNLFKTSAWETFNGHSSNKIIKYSDNQLRLLFDEYNPVDANCYTIQDVADFLIQEHKGKSEVYIGELFLPLKNHQIFPYDGFRREIKSFILAKGVIKRKLSRREVYDFSRI